MEPGLGLPGVPPRPSGGGALLVTKLAVPQLSRSPVIRPRLLTMLDQAARRPLTLLAAPAGSGKTVLLASWLAGGQPPGPVAWVTLDAQDDATRLWTHVLAALRQSGAAIDDTALAGAAAPVSTGDYGFLVQLVNGLATFTTPVVIVLDDLHEVRNPAVMGQLRFLMQHAPPQLRLVLATRADPQLPLHRLRVTGEIAEIRAADLAFTLAEAEQFLDDAEVRLTAADLESLWACTEGWAAGLRLAAQSLRRHPEPERFVAEFTGENWAVAGYLAEEVLARQTPDARQFMLSTSVADRLRGGLADALVGRTGSAAVLARLASEHAFLTALGPQHDWYAYHPLFAQLLRAELQRKQPGRVAELHRRAATWYGVQGMAAEAFHHALLAADTGLAAELLTVHWFAMLADGRVSALVDLLGQLPAAQLRADPELSVVAAICQLALGAPEQADDWLSRADEAAGPVPAGGDRFMAARTIARLYRARLHGDLVSASASAEELLALPSEPGGLQLADGPTRRSLALANLGAAELWNGRFAVAATQLRAARVDAERSGRDDVVLDTTGHLAVLEMLSGRLTRAVELAGATRDRAVRAGWPASPAQACAELALAGVLYHRNDLDNAAQAVERATGMTSARSDRTVALAAALVEAWLLVCLGHEDAADGLGSLRAALRELGRPQASLLDGAARRLEARLLVAAGEPEAALEIFERRRVGRPTAEDTVMLARLRLVNGDPVGAARIRLRELGDEAAELRLPARIEAWLLDAMISSELAEHDRAGHSLERAIELAAPEGFRRVFVEAGDPARVLLARHLEEGAAQPGVAELLETLGRPVVAASGADGPVEPLSERERIVLRYLSSMLSASEIAAELYVSVNTVKTHVRSIYRKLDTNRRRDAVRRAKELQLL
jgi:LuxR family maltose regulon positive regulatory protein